MSTPAFKLEDFQISRTNGFLLDNPATRLPSEFCAWEELAKSMTELVERKLFREKVDKMTLLDHSNLKSYREKRLAHLLLSVIGSGYVWQDGDAGVSRALPECLSVPWWSISAELGIKPILSHVSLVLANWTVSEKDGSVDWICGLPGGQSSKPFVLITREIEKTFAAGLICLEKAVLYLSAGDTNGLVECLNNLIQVIIAMKALLSKMHGSVNSADFYHKIRPFLAGWGNPGSVLPDGIVYTGVSDKPKKCLGGSAAQSSIFQSLDAFLGIKHIKGQGAFLLDMRSYMPPAHRQFIETLEMGPSLREYVEKSKCQELRNAYHRCLDALVQFRSYHVQIVTKYIVSIAHKKAGDEAYESLSNQGTGGSDLLPFLKAIRSTTEAARLEFPQENSFK